jgi:hypothetical protein
VSGGCDSKRYGLTARAASLYGIGRSERYCFYLSGMDKWLERLVFTRATAVVGVTEEHAAAFRQTYPHLPADKFAAMPNGYDNGEWDNLPADMRRDEKSEGKFLMADPAAIAGFDRRVLAGRLTELFDRL